MIFYTRYSYPVTVGEFNDGTYNVDPTGYVPAQRLVENMLYAGAILDQNRRDDFDFNEGDKLEYKKTFDMRSPDLDPSDIARVMRDVASGSSEGKVDSGSADTDSSGVGGSNSGESGSSGESGASE